MAACNGCYEKQLKIDRLAEEVARLKQKLGYRERKEKEGFFGSSTPSSKIPIKSNTSAGNQTKNGGAVVGHKGNGRRGATVETAEAEERIVVDMSICPDCGERLEDRGYKDRTVVESAPVRAKRTLYHLGQKRCPKCRKEIKAKVPSVLPRNLYGNQLLSHVATNHYLHGIPLGRVLAEVGISAEGSLFEALHRLARIFGDIPKRLMEDYRQSAVKHADETGWRNNGLSGYSWIFCTTDLSLFLFKKTRSSQVPRDVFGDKPLPGVLVVDRYNAYNKSPCSIQYCYAHLLREFEDIEKQFPDEVEVKAFTSTSIPLLTQAMKLRGQPITDEEFYKQAAFLREQIIKVMNQEAKHLGIRRLQDIFRENEQRLYHWASDRRVPADNNMAERDLRPTVIARKVSFGSQSDNGANTRSVLMSVLHTLKKRVADPVAQFKLALDVLAKNPSLDPYPLLFPNTLPP